MKRPKTIAHGRGDRHHHSGSKVPSILHELNKIKHRTDTGLPHVDIGNSMDEFTLLEELGKGAFGTVFKVLSKKDNKPYVIKRIRLKLFSKEKDALKEVLILKQLNNPNIVKYYNSFIEHECLFIVMEFAEGGDLHKTVRAQKEAKKHFPEAEIWKTALQLLIAVDYLHSHNVIHCDIKSPNVFLSKDGNKKLGDMGLSKILSSSINQIQPERIGTPLYFAPEMIRKQPFDNRIDIWAIGVVLYYMSTFEHPFDDNSIYGIGMKILNKIPKALPSCYSPRLQSLIWAMLEKQPSLRPRAKELIETHFSNEISGVTEEDFKEPENEEPLPIQAKANATLNEFRGRLPPMKLVDGRMTAGSSKFTFNDLVKDERIIVPKTVFTPNRLKKEEYFDKGTPENQNNSSLNGHNINIPLPDNQDDIAKAEISIMNQHNHLPNPKEAGIPRKAPHISKKTGIGNSEFQELNMNHHMNSHHNGVGYHKSSTQLISLGIGGVNPMESQRPFPHCYKYSIRNNQSLWKTGSNILGKKNVMLPTPSDNTPKGHNANDYSPDISPLYKPHLLQQQLDKMHSVETNSLMVSRPCIFPNPHINSNGNTRSDTNVRNTRITIRDLITK